jgi:hypothetical protein
MGRGTRKTFGQLTHLRKVDLHENVILPVVTRQRRQIAVQLPTRCNEKTGNQ